MLDAYGRRRQRELHEMGSVEALAHHDPKNLKKLEPRRRKRPVGEKWWRTKENA